MPLVAALDSIQREEAATLYKSGLSVQQVADYFGVGIDATFYALRKLAVPRRTAQEANRVRFEAKPLSYRIKESLSPEEERLRLAAIMLYWAEGYKAASHTVDFANSDPDMVVVFRRFLSEVCNVDESRLRCYMYCYEGQDIPAIRSFWSRLLNIPESQFTKPYIKRAAPGPRGPRMIHGLVHVRYCDKKLLRQVLNWIEKYKQECVGTQVVNEVAL